MRLDKWAVAAFAACLMGCDYTVRLAETPQTPIDQALIGSWSRKEGERTDHLLVLPLGPKEYLVAYPAREKNAMYARGCLCQAGGLTLVQLTWFGTGEGEVADDGRVYQYAVYTVKGDTLQVGLLNPEVVDRDVKSAADLARLIAANRDKPEFFRDALTFTREKRAEAPNAPLKRPPLPAAWQ